MGEVERGLGSLGCFVVSRRHVIVVIGLFFGLALDQLGLLLPLLELLLDAVDVLLADLDEEDSVDDVEVVQHASHLRGLDLDGWQGGLGLAGVDLVHLLLEHDGLLRQVLEALGRFPGLVVVVTQLRAVDGVRLLLVLKGRPE